MIRNRYGKLDHWNLESLKELKGNSDCKIRCV